MLQTLLAADRRATEADALEDYCLDLLAALTREHRRARRWRAFADEQFRQRLAAERATRKAYAQITEMRLGIRSQVAIES